tara:strand:- start:2636 stop:3457 length:822 start_codon:yes stop_codon:yes gene_type:complete
MSEVEELAEITKNLSLNCDNTGKSKKPKKKNKINPKVKNDNQCENILENEKNISELKNVKKCLEDNLDQNTIQEIFDKTTAVNNKSKGDGCGLKGGSDVDDFLCQIFKENLGDLFKEEHKHESDFKLNNTSLSLKKIKNKANIGLNWSKNKKNKNKKNKKEILIKHFNVHIMIVILEDKQWWKTNPKKFDISKINKNKNFWNSTIKKGIYLIDKEFCRKNIEITDNNKTNKVIEHPYVYSMLKRSLEIDTFIPFPEKIKNKYEVKYDFIKLEE